MMNRRDFLKLRARGDERVLELSCERLYMRYVDALASTDLGGATEAGAGWSGEPPTAIAVPTTVELFADLERRLTDADVLRVLGREWLAGGDFRREVEARIEAFRRQGGRVE
jgi:hypothetical protein